MSRASLAAAGAWTAPAYAPWVVGVLCLASPAAASDLALKIEPGASIPLTAPQSELYNAGGGQTVKLLFGVSPWLDLGPSLSFVGLSPMEPVAADGTAWTAGGGIRLKRPRLADGASGAERAVSPWLDADALYVRTGDLNRPGFAVGAGLAVPVGPGRGLWLGPFVRYFHILQPAAEGFDNRDAQVLTAGLSLDFGRSAGPEPVVVASAPVAPPPAEAEDCCPDTDGDTVPDTIDRCPEEAGPLTGEGCPVYETVVVTPEKLELRQKLYFAWNQAVLEDASLPVLDDVARALNDRPDLRVQIEGHASSEGGDDRNQTLSERRAAAVRDYLIGQGVAAERLRSKGFSSSVPLETNATESGREANRRVEFVVYFTILTDGGTQ